MSDVAWLVSYPGARALHSSVFFGSEMTMKILSSRSCVMAHIEIRDFLGEQAIVPLRAESTNVTFVPGLHTRHLRACVS